MPNTRIMYTYADADNYHIPQSVVIPGVITPKNKLDILASLADGEFFMPCKVGMPEKKFGTQSDADHDWFSMDAPSFELTEEIPSLDIDPETLASRFAACKGRWETAIPIEIT